MLPILQNTCDLIRKFKINFRRSSKLHLKPDYLRKANLIDYKPFNYLNHF